MQHAGPRRCQTIEHLKERGRAVIRSVELGRIQTNRNGTTVVIKATTMTAA